MRRARSETTGSLVSGASGDGSACPDAVEPTRASPSTMVAIGFIGVRQRTRTVAARTPVGMSDPTLHLGPGVRVMKDALSWSYARSGGPGGQNVNKRSTKAILRVSLGDLRLSDATLDRVRAAGQRYLTNDDELVIAADEHRERARNRDACLDRLAGLLVSASTPPKKRRPTRPTRGSVERRIAAKKRRGDIKSRRGERHE